MRFIFSLYLCFSISLLGFSQVHIGRLNHTNSKAVLDLENDVQGSLLLDFRLSEPDVLIKKPGGMLYYFDGMLYLSQGGIFPKWNVISPWVFNGNNSDGVSYPYFGRSGIGIGINTHAVGYNPALDYNYPTNFHVAQFSKEVTDDTFKSSSLLIGDTVSSSLNPNYEYLLIDNDEILTKKASGDAGVLKLQEFEGGKVFVGDEVSNSASLNVFGKVKERTGNIQPSSSVIMWYGDTTSTNFINGLGIGRMTGWGICNGKTYTYNGNNTETPNLQGRFTVGAGTRANKVENSTSTTAISFTQKTYGGLDQIFQHANEVAEHLHGPGNLETGNNDNTTHNHNHDIMKGSDSGSGLDDGGEQGVSESSKSLETRSGGDHTHSLTGGLDYTANPSAAMPNLPEYYVVVYLMKLK